MVNMLSVSILVKVILAASCVQSFVESGLAMKCDARQDDGLSGSSFLSCPLV